MANYKISILEIIWKPVEMFMNLRELYLMFNKFNLQAFEQALDIIPKFQMMTRIKFNQDFLYDYYSVCHKNGLLFYKSKGKWYIIKSHNLEITFGPCSKIYYSNQNVFVFESWVQMDLSKIEVLAQDDKSYKMFNYYLSEIKENWFEKHGNYFAIINKNYHKFKFDFLFKHFLPNPKSIKHMEVIFRKDWNKPNLEKFKSFLNNVSQNTLIYIDIKELNKTVLDWLDWFLEKSVWSIHISTPYWNKYAQELKVVSNFILKVLK